MSEHAFASFVRTLGRGKRARRSLTREEAAEAMTHILQGEVTQAQLGAFLMLLRVKEETPEELAGFLDACRPLCSHYLIGLPKADVDWPSYAGKKKHHPWYLLAARLLASNGVRVFMHGGPAHTPERHYTDESLRRLGFHLPRDIHEAADQLHDDGFTYLGVEQFCPPLSTLLMLRFQLGLRSPINTLARNLNPAQAPLSLQSVFHPAYLTLHLEASRLCGDQNLLLFKGEGGEVEIRPDARTSIGGLRAGQPVETTLDAALPRQTPPGSVSTDHLKAVWRGEENDPYGEAAVRQTVATTLWGLGKAKDLDDATKTAQTLWVERKRDAL